MTSRYDQQGQVQVPLATSGVSAGGSLVSIADPTIEDLLDKFQEVLKDKLDSAWNKCAGQISSTACKSTYPYEPIPVLSRLSWKWPALFMWRTQERYSNHTAVYRKATSTGHLMYVLPPLPYAKAVQLEPIRVAARVVLDMYIHERGDPDVASGANPMSANQLMSFSFVSGDYDYLEGPEVGLAHPMLDMTFEMEERQSHVQGNYTALTRIDTTIEVMPEETYATGTDLTVTYWDNGNAFDSGFTTGFLVDR